MFILIKPLDDRISQHQDTYKSQHLRSNFFQYSLNFDNTPDFLNNKILELNLNMQSKQYFLEAFYTKYMKYK